MRQCEDFAKLEYEAYLRELKKGLCVINAMKAAYAAGAPMVLMRYEVLRRHFWEKNKTGKYLLDYKKHKALIAFLDSLYEWWLERVKTVKNKRHKYICLEERLEQPAMWPISFDSFRGHIYKYMRGKYKNKRLGIF